MRKLLLALIAAAALAVPSTANAAYNHVSVCKNTLRGNYGSDDDIHRFGAAYGATSFGRWGHYWHSLGEVYVYGLFNYPGGIQRWHLGHCWGGDYGPDTIG